MQRENLLQQCIRLNLCTLLSEFLQPEDVESLQFVNFGKWKHVNWVVRSERDLHIPPSVTSLYYAKPLPFFEYGLSLKRLGFCSDYHLPIHTNYFPESLRELALPRDLFALYAGNFNLPHLTTLTIHPVHLHRFKDSPVTHLKLWRGLVLIPEILKRVTHLVIERLVDRDPIYCGWSVEFRHKHLQIRGFLLCEHLENESHYIRIL